MDPAPSASGNGCRLPVYSGPGRKSATNNRPPSRLVVDVPGAVVTRTSKREPLGAPGGITPSTITTAESLEFSSCCGVIFGEPGAPLPKPRFASSCERNARTSDGICRLPVSRRPTTIPYPRTTSGSNPTSDVSDATVPRMIGSMSVAATATASRFTAAFCSAGSARSTIMSEHPMITMLAATVATVLAVIQRSARIVVIGEGMGARTLVGDCQGIRAKREGKWALLDSNQ